MCPPPNTLAPLPTHPSQVTILGREYCSVHHTDKEHSPRYGAHGSGCVLRRNKRDRKETRSNVMKNGGKKNRT